LLATADTQKDRRGGAGLFNRGILFDISGYSLL